MLLGCIAKSGTHWKKVLPQAVAEGLAPALLNLMHACPHGGYGARGRPLLTHLGSPHVCVKPHDACSTVKSYIKRSFALVSFGSPATFAMEDYGLSYDRAASLVTWLKHVCIEHLIPQNHPQLTRNHTWQAKQHVT